MSQILEESALFQHKARHSGDEFGSFLGREVDNVVGYCSCRQTLPTSTKEHNKTLRLGDCPANSNSFISLFFVPVVLSILSCVTQRNNGATANPMQHAMHVAAGPPARRLHCAQSGTRALFVLEPDALCSLFRPPARCANFCTPKDTQSPPNPRRHNDVR